MAKTSIWPTVKQTIGKYFPAIAGAVAALAVGLLLGSATTVNITKDEGGNPTVVVESSFSMELSEQQVPALVENADGVVEEVSVPTVEEINGNQVLAPEDKLPDLGQGAYYDVSSPQAFADATMYKCIDMDGYYGSQCVDLAAAFWLSYTNRWPSVCGTGSAYGLWDCREQNAGEDFNLITDPNALQAGDWVVFGGGQYGHVGMALGPTANGYVALLGENQGGASCENGGAATNIINMSTKTFLGAFRPKAYIVPEPAPEPTPDPAVIPITGCLEWYVNKGDTMSGIMLNCEGTVVYGEAMNNYAKSWYSRYIKPGQSVYDGWHSATGVGLYETDTIDHKVGE